MTHKDAQALFGMQKTKVNTLTHDEMKKTEGNRWFFGFTTWVRSLNGNFFYPIKTTFYTL